MVIDGATGRVEEKTKSRAGRVRERIESKRKVRGGREKGKERVTRIERYIDKDIKRGTNEKRNNK